MNIKKFINNPIPYFRLGTERVKNMFRSNFYRGNNVKCDLCGWEGQKFFNQKCPNCNALPRTRLIPFSLKHFDLLQPNTRILHVAPNKNEFNFIKNSISDMTNYDRLNIREVNHINIVQDLTNTNLDSNQYDLAIAWHVLEHIPEDSKAIKEIYRLLKPNGNFLVSVPIYPVGNRTTFEDANLAYEDYEKVHGHYDHCRSCGYDYYMRFEQQNFSTRTLLVNNISEAEINSYGLRKDHVVWCFNKN